ncbi:MAG TPA: hypothetical protein VGO50_02865 [Pyrinomonadaceae bacterium]|jgi:hypothetical protein|nr:hypothetical protein [Pyrinomonadaceae bacterium]
MNKEFKVWYGTTLATQEQLDAIEEIVVEQEVGHVWEARIKIPVCVDENGHWEKEDAAAYHEGNRIRVEARIGNGEFTPLIDGLITSKEPDYNASPGLSAVTLMVQDDSVLLHRNEVSATFRGQSAAEIVKALFQSASLPEPVVDVIPAPPDRTVIENQHGTAMDALRYIASRNRDFYAYVLPGASQGTSECFFKQLPTEVDETLAPLFLGGPNRNMSGFSIRQNANRLATFEGPSLNMSDNSPRPGRSEAAAPAEGEPATAVSEETTRNRRLAPGNSDHTDPQEASNRAAATSSFTLSAEGSVRPSCYPSVLKPYKRVPVRLSNSRYSGSYVIFKVTHTLGRSEYTQSFSMRGNSVSPEASTSASAPAPAASAGALAAAFNIQADIY